MFTFRIMYTDVKIIANFVKTRQGNGLTFEEVLRSMLSCLRTLFSFCTVKTREGNLWQV